MVDYYLDERTVDALSEMRAARKKANEETYLDDLISVIQRCRSTGKGFAEAIKHWLTSLEHRIAKTIRRLKMPHVLREALGLSSQEVILENGSLWSAVNGGKVTLLYYPLS